MIQPNFNLFLWLVFILYGLNGLCGIINGVMGTEKDNRYGASDIAAGFIQLVIIVIVLVW